MKIILSQIVIKVNKIHSWLWITIVSTDGREGVPVAPGNLRTAFLFLSRQKAFYAP